MVQESTMICLDNSEWMRNGDLAPNRLQCQQEAVRVLIQYKLRSNPENAVGLLSMADNIQVLSSMTTEDRKILSKLFQVEIQGSSSVIRSIKTAHLVLKNRPNRNHKTRIVVFIGSPLDNLEEGYEAGEFARLSKRLKKENIKIDFVLFGEAASEANAPVLDFVEMVNGKDGSGSNVVVVPGDSKLFEALLSSPICQNEDGTGGRDFDFGMDADDDPELALALRVSLEEQRQRQRHEAGGNNEAEAGANEGMDVDLQRDNDKTPAIVAPDAVQANEGLSTPLKLDNIDPAAMTEEEQLEWVLRMSLMPASPKNPKGEETASSSTNENRVKNDALLKPVPIYPGTVGGLEPESPEAPVRDVENEIFSSTDATASGTPAPTPMETEPQSEENGNSTALGQLMQNPDLLKQLVDQMPNELKENPKKANKKQ